MSVCGGCVKYDQNALTIVHGFRPESEFFIPAKNDAIKMGT